MASTIIDELIVSLSLDSSQFTQQQQRAINSLRGFDQQVGNTTKNVGSDATQMRAYFAAIEHPLTALKEGLFAIATGSKKTREENTKNLTDLSAQSRRSGIDMQAGAEAGAVGFRNLAIAGLAAFAAIKAVQGAMEAVHDQTQKNADLGRAAYFTGVAPAWLYGAKAYGETRGVPGAATQETIQGFNRMRQQYVQLGGEGPFKDIASKLGLLDLPTGTDVINEPIETLLPKIIDAIARKPAAEQQVFAESVGLGGIENMVPFGGQAFTQGANYFSQFAPTAGDLRAAFEYQQAIARLDAEFDKGKNLIITPFINEGLLPLLHTLSDLGEALSKVGAGMETFYDAILPPWLRIALNGMGTLHSLTHPNEPGPHAPTSLSGAISDLIFGRDRTPTGTSAVPGEGTAAPTSVPPTETRTWWERRPTWLGGTPASQVPTVRSGGTPMAPGGSPGELPPAAAEAISRAEGTYGPQGINWNEVYGGGTAPLTDMSLQQVLDYAAQMPGSQDVGGMQLNRGNIGPAARALNLDLNTTKFTPDIQRRIAGWVNQTQGPNAWVGLRAHPDQMQNFQRAMIAPAIQKPEGGVVGPGASAVGVDPQLDETMRYAVSRLPQGYTAKLTAGQEAGHVSGSEHHTGQAEDWQIYDLQGHPIANRGADTTGLYRKMAVDAMAYAIVKHPEMANRFAWGGHFETSPGSGIADLMHYGDRYGPRGQFGDPNAERAAAIAQLSQAQAGNVQLAQAGVIANAGGAPRTSHNDNSVDNDVNVHTINVHLGETGAMKAGGAIGSALRSHIVYPADTGVE